MRKHSISQAINERASRMGGCFPLTPALPHGERENRSPSQARWFDGESFNGLGAKKIVPLLFPLPEGEGQGEGKQDSARLRKTKGRMFAA